MTKLSGKQMYEQGAPSADVNDAKTSAVFVALMGTPKKEKRCVDNPGFTAASYDCGKRQQKYRLWPAMFAFATIASAWCAVHRYPRLWLS